MLAGDRMMGDGQQAAGAAEDVQPEGKGPEQGRQEPRLSCRPCGARTGAAAADAPASTGSAASEVGLKASIVH